MGTMGVTDSLILHKEPDFMIKGLYRFYFMGQELWLTSTTISLTIVSILLIILAILAKRTLNRATDVPNGFQNFLEFIFEMLEKMGDSILGSNAPRFINYIGTIFLFILLSNFSGLLGLRNPTAEYGVTFLLGLVTFVIIHYQGFKNHGHKHITGLFEPLPVLFPINLIGEFANPISISLRLFANILSGVVMLGLWYGMMPIFMNIGVPAFLQLYTDVFSGAIQTYVFCMLSMVYINDKL